MTPIGAVPEHIPPTAARGEPRETTKVGLLVLGTDSDSDPLARGYSEPEPLHRNSQSLLVVVS